jgi:putative PIN family toxin of toxin-antitoxin system
MPQIRVVLDTNVVLSSLLFRTGRLSRIRHGWQGKHFVPVVCNQTMAELLRVLGYKKFKLDQADIGNILAMYMPYVEIHALSAPPSTAAHTPQCRDPKDQMFLDLAQSAKVDYLVTGDEDLLVLDDADHQHSFFNICTPLDFLTCLEPLL